MSVCERWFRASVAPLQHILEGSGIFSKLETTVFNWRQTAKETCTPLHVNRRACVQGALAWYSALVLAMALNGVAEAFVHASATPSQVTLS